LHKKEISQKLKDLSSTFIILQQAGARSIALKERTIMN
jgi:pseudouridine-5'-phosphate glycosidase